MPTATQPPRSTSAISQNVGASIALSVGLIAIIVLSICVLRRKQPPVRVSAFVAHLNVDEEQQVKRVRSYMLESIPVVRYSANLLQPKEQDRVKEARDPTYLPKDEAQVTTLRGEFLHADTKTTIKTEYNLGTTCATLSTLPSGTKRQSEAKSSLLHKNISLKQEPQLCSICTELFVEGENVRVLPCSHVYHCPCIDPWLVDFAGTCPLCRETLQHVTSLAAHPQRPGHVLLSSER